MSTPVHLQIIIGLFLFGVIFVTLERKFPLRRQRVFRRGWATDIQYFVAGCYAGKLSTLASIAMLAWLCRMTGLPYPQFAAHQPGWLQFLEILLISDFLAYVFHRLMHAIPWLWRFHSIHHSSQEMDWLVNVRAHPVDKILADCFQLLPILCLGFAPLPLLAYTAVLGLQGFLNHSNVRADYGPLRWLIASPQFHHWHHCDNPETYNKNFATHLVVFDLIFGTALIPPSNAMPTSYGVTDKVPEGFLGQLVHPFREEDENEAGAAGYRLARNHPFDRQPGGRA